MTALLQRLERTGVVLANPFRPPTHYVPPRRGDGARDFSRIASDMRGVDRDFRRVAAKELASGPKTN